MNLLVLGTNLLKDIFWTVKWDFKFFVLSWEWIRYRQTISSFKDVTIKLIVDMNVDAGPSVLPFFTDHLLNLWVAVYSELSKPSKEFSSVLYSYPFYQSSLPNYKTWSINFDWFNKFVNWVIVFQVEEYTDWAYINDLCLKSSLVISPTDIVSAADLYFKLT